MVQLARAIDASRAIALAAAVALAMLLAATPVNADGRGTPSPTNITWEITKVHLEAAGLNITWE